MTRREMAKSIIRKNLHVVALTRRLAADDMAGLECSHSVMRDKLLCEIAAEGVLLARDILKES